MEVISHGDGVHSDMVWSRCVLRFLCSPRESSLRPKVQQESVLRVHNAENKSQDIRWDKGFFFRDAQIFQSVKEVSSKGSLTYGEVIS